MQQHECPVMIGADEQESCFATLSDAGPAPLHSFSKPSGEGGVDGMSLLRSAGMLACASKSGKYFCVLTVL